jgi:hypothetical protein
MRENGRLKSSPGSCGQDLDGLPLHKKVQWFKSSRIKKNKQPKAMNE